MTQCALFPIEFSKSSRQKIVADFDAPQISSDGGVLLLREVDKKLGLIKRVAKCFTDTRQLGKVKYSIQTMLSQRIFAIALGYEDGNDHTDLRNDPLLQLCAANPGQELASPSTLCRFENKALSQGMWGMSELFVDIFLESHSTPPRQIVLDFDATDDAVHGNQEGRGFHGYYDHYCFLPLYVFSGDHLLAAYLRPSLIDGAKNSRAVLKLLVRKIRSRWPKVRIIVRGDSGFCRDKLMVYCEKNDLDYIFGLARNKRLEKAIETVAQEAEERFARTSRKQRLFTEFEYSTLKSWSCQRRVIAKAEHTKQGSNNRFIVTSLRSYTAKHLYDKLYCARGEMENRIKEQQLHLFADRTSCSKFMANQFRLMLASSAYVLVNELRRRGLKETAFARATCQTIRLKLLKIGAIVTLSVRRCYVRLSSAYPYQRIFTQVAAALRALG
jgi:hypothetical protein